MTTYEHERREKRTKYVGPRPGFPEKDASLWQDMLDYLSDRNLSFALARENGWYPARYQYAPRIVIPCSNSAGVPYFQARDMSGKAKLRYASPPASRDDSLVLVWPEGIVKNGMVVVEGPMDALAAAELGHVGIAIMGNQPTEAVLNHLAFYAHSFQPVVVLPDADALEFGPTVLCYLGQCGISAGIMVPRKKDLAELDRKERRNFLHALPN